MNFQPRSLNFTEFAAHLRAKIGDSGTPDETYAINAISFIAEWGSKAPFVLRNPGSPVWPKLRRVLSTKEFRPGNFQLHPREWGPFIRDFRDNDPQLFVVENNWVAAFEGATDFTDGSYRLPYNKCCFEFLLNGLRVCFLAQQTEGEEPEGILFAAKDDHWFGIDAARDPSLVALENTVRANVRALCIALDAEVAYTEVVRVPQKLNAARLKSGKDPLPDYRVVKLRQRPRATPLEQSESIGTRKRLHFRRGHWRHFTEHKTWIKWTLVGDPDMAFVDKHYRA